MAAKVEPFWKRKTLEQLDLEEWESLCDGCAQCCLHKLEDADTGEILPTNVACKLLDTGTAQCKDYCNRKAYVPDCLRLTMRNVADQHWLPRTCAYRLRAEGEPLPDWHYLVCGDRDAVHRAGQSIVGWTVGEDVAGPLENHLVERVV